MTAKTIGIIGGGQLGRMLAMAAARLNFRTVILEPQADCPAAQVANRQIVGAYDDPAALAELGRSADIVTYEFENVPVSAAERLAEDVPVYPAAEGVGDGAGPAYRKALHQRLRHSDRPVSCRRQSGRSRSGARGLFGGKGVLKTRRLGYDGKGQRVYRSSADSPAGGYAALGGVPLILESFVAFEREISVIAARGADGAVACYDPAENVHRDGILHTSTVPATISDATAAAARDAAAKILAALDYVGVIGIEFFVLADGGLIANEMAPRVHNSGHWTEAACVVSQFEQHIRAVAGLPLGNAARHSDCVMQNLIGDDILSVPDWLKRDGVLVHLYGKTEARPGRKMGHVTELKSRH